MSWKVEVQADSTGTWAGNALRFASEIAALDYARCLEDRWTAVRGWRLIETDDPVNEPSKEV